MKAFPKNDSYYSWIYLGTADGSDYYLQSLPTKDRPYPSYSIVYGPNNYEYISTTLQVDEMLDNDALAKKLPLYAEHKTSSYMLHMIAFVRHYYLTNLKTGEQHENS